MMRMMLLTGAALLMPAMAAAQEAIVRVVDVGPGLCVIASIPGDHHLLYDAGHWTGSNCRDAVREVVTDKSIELVVISHSDSDHLGELNEILAENSAGVILTTGNERMTATYRQAVDAIAAEIPEGTTVLNLKTWPLQPGTTFSLGEAKVTFVAGWHEWDRRLSSRTLPQSELRNVISIVMRLEYGGKSVLLTGDTIGRTRGSAPAACEDAERFMVREHRDLLRSTVLVAGHHGGDNATASCFASAVAPEFVIFSAGHDHHHPTQGAADRIRAAGVPATRIFRTDRGDDEGEGEWTQGRVAGCTDGRGDDDVEIRIPRNAGGPVIVRHRSAGTGC